MRETIVEAMTESIKHYFWRHGIDLTDEQESKILELDVCFSAATYPGFAYWLAPTLSRLSPRGIEKLSLSNLECMNDRTEANVQSD